jgi:hypothetical protein
MEVKSIHIKHSLQVKEQKTRTKNINPNPSNIKRNLKRGKACIIHFTIYALPVAPCTLKVSSK